MERTELRWIHDCFEQKCTSTEIVIRFVDVHDHEVGVEVPNMYCKKTGRQLRLVQLGEHKL